MYGRRFKKQKNTSRIKAATQPLRPPLRNRPSDARTTTNHYQEESKPRRTPRRGVESGVRGFRDRDDGVVHRAVADEQQRQDPKGGRGLFQGSDWNFEDGRNRHGGRRRKLRCEQGQHGAAEGAVAEVDPRSSE